MSYSYKQPKTPPCPVERTGAAQGKHKWAFVRNFNQVSTSHGLNGSTMRVSLKGLYKCECGAQRAGKFNSAAADLRELLDVSKQTIGEGA